ncbi:replication initiation protein, partial [Aerococcus viridans]
EIKDNKDLEIAAENLWRIEFELKREMTEKWSLCFDDLNIIKPDWKMVEKFSERAAIYLLLNEDGEWGNMNRKTKYKYKNILKEISPIDLKNNMQEELNLQREKLQKELDFWLGE